METVFKIKEFIISESDTNGKIVSGVVDVMLNDAVLADFRMWAEIPYQPEMSLSEMEDKIRDKVTEKLLRAAEVAANS